MIHPAMGQIYMLSYIDLNGQFQSWQSWSVHRPETMVDEIRHSMERLQQRLPGTASELLWLSGAGKWEKIYVPGLTSNPKYALFSED